MRNMMRTFLLLLFLLPIAHGEPAQAQEEACAPGVSLSSSASATYATDVTEDVALITAYWEEIYPRLYGGEFPGVCAAIEYTVPNVPFAAMCGLTPDIASQNAFYCIPAETVMWDGPNFFHPIYETYGDKAITYIIAHEYGHAAQFLSGTYPPGPRTVNIEIQADCLAGAYLQYEVDNDLMNEDEAREVIVIAAQFGQARLGTRWVDRSHGTSAQRLAALNTGFDGGADTCIDYEPSPAETLTDLEEQIEEAQAEIVEQAQDAVEDLPWPVQDRLGDRAEERATQQPRRPGFGG
ncbi:MAG: neutral zinc metallopeptidase [Chloroflexota bacterium]